MSAVWQHIIGGTVLGCLLADACIHGMMGEPASTAWRLVVVTLFFCREYGV